MKRRYRRYFIILEGENAGFEISKGQNPKGYGKIEVSNGKGTMTLYCQNLKKVDGKGIRYRWYLVNTRTDEEPVIVDIGPMEVDNTGKGELIWEFSAENVKGSGQEIEQFNILALAAERMEGQTNLITPLVGYIDKEKVQWKRVVEEKLYGLSKTRRTEERYRAVEKKIPPDPKEKEEKKEKPIPKGNQQKSIDSEHNIIQESVPKTKVGHKLKEGKKEENSLATIEEKQGIKKDEKQEIEKREEKLFKKDGKQEIVKEEKTLMNKEEKSSMKREEKQGKKEISPYSFEEKSDPVSQLNIPGKEEIRKSTEKKNSLQFYIENTLKSFPEISPFDANLEGYRWWHIHYNHQTMYRDHMPFIAYIESARAPYYPSHYYQLIYMYQHYIFGICYDQEKAAKYYVYGIPGRKTVSEQPYEGRTGFVYWHPCYQKLVDREASGYWLLHIDAETGKVVKPLPATTPLQ